MKKLMRSWVISTVLGIACVAYSVEPDEFVPYVEATGAQYVDTGIIGRSGTKIECQVEWLAFKDSAFVASGDYQKDTRFYACYCLNTSGEVFGALRKGSSFANGHGTNYVFELNRVYTYTSDFSAPAEDGSCTNTVMVNGSKFGTLVAEALDTEVNLFVFACNRKGQAISLSNARCYGLKIWQDDTLVRDFKPCVKDGVAGLYDAVTKEIFYSGSGTALTYDVRWDTPDAWLEYVESMGNTYIDTGIIGRSGTAAKMEMAFTANADQAFLDARTDNTRFYLIHNNGGNKWLYGYGDCYSFGSFVEGRKYYVESSLDVGLRLIKIGENGASGATTTYVNETSETAIDTGRSLYLFSCNYNKYFESKFTGRGRVYWLQIFQDGKLVRDFKPCLKNDKAALYDAVSKKIFYPVGRALAFDNSAPARADEVAFVDYIESNGRVYLDTQVHAKTPLRASGTFSWTQLREKKEELQCLDGVEHRTYLGCGHWNNENDANRFYMIDATARKPWLGYGNKAHSFGSYMVTGTKYTFDVSYADGSQTFSMTPGNGMSANQTWAGAADGQGSLYLFACNDAANNSVLYPASARCYGLTLYQGDTPVRVFRPCIKDGFVGLYDTLSGRVFFTTPRLPAKGYVGDVLPESLLSPVAAYLEYVETDGTLALDTGVAGRVGTVAEFRETNLCPKKDREECFLGACGPNNLTDRFYMWYHASAYTLGIGYGALYWRPSQPGSSSNYSLAYGDTTHARVSFAAGAQTVTIIDDATKARTTISEKTDATGVDTGHTLSLFARNNNGAYDSFCSTRFYYLKLWKDGTSVRVFQPVRLQNGLVALWDFVEGKAYCPRTASGSLAFFAAVGPETERISGFPFILTVR